MNKIANSIRQATGEWLHLIDPQRRKRKFHLVDNWITTHKNARYIALTAYVVGVVLVSVSTATTGLIALISAYMALVVWIIPVMWVAHKWSTSK